MHEHVALAVPSALWASLAPAHLATSMKAAVLCKGDHVLSEGLDNLGLDLCGADGSVADELGDLGAKNAQGKFCSMPQVGLPTLHATRLSSSSAAPTRPLMRALRWSAGLPKCLILLP